MENLDILGRPAAAKAVGLLFKSILMEHTALIRNVRADYTFLSSGQRSSSICQSTRWPKRLKPLFQRTKVVLSVNASKSTLVAI